MVAATHTSSEEDAFMADILNTITDDFFNAVPSPDPSPRKPATKPKPQNLPLVNANSAAVVAAQDVDMAALVDGAEDWDWGDMESDFLTPKKGPGRKRGYSSPSLSAKPELATALKLESEYFREPCTRCVVESVVENEDARGRYQKDLTVKLDHGEERRFVILRDDWTQTDVRVGDTINIIGLFTPLPCHSNSTTGAPPPKSTITLTASANLLVLHPDTLLTATALSSAPTCPRKPILSLLLRSTSCTSATSTDITPSLVWGNILHEVMQACLRAGRWDDVWIEERIAEEVRREKGLGDLVKLGGVGVEEAVREVKARAGGLKVFGEKYMRNLPKSDAILTDTRSTHGAEPALLAITHLHDVEEDIWSPVYGLKGKLDATVQAVITGPPPISTATKFTSKSKSNNANSKTKTAAITTTITHPTPLEIKTGRALIASTAHRAQTLLYTLLTSARYGTRVPSGLLYYTQSEEVVRVGVGWNEIRGLVGSRNEVVGYLVRRAGGKVREKEKEKEPILPPTIDDERVCKRCYALDACMLYRKAVDNVQDDDRSSIAEIYALKTGHLTSSQASFFKEWEGLIALEEMDIQRFKKELWTMGAQEREEKGRCFAGVVLEVEATEGAANGGKGIHQFTYTFTRGRVESKKGAINNSDPQSSLLNGHMSVGDAITVSVEPDLLALARGYIVELTPFEVVVGVDHEVSLKTIETRLEALKKARAGVKGFNSDWIEKGQKDADGRVVFRIDKDEMWSGLSRIRDNLAQLFYAGGDSKRLSLVVDLTPPVFTSPVHPPSLPPSVTSHLNSNQLSAISKALSAQDYALILGMPGTGKTTVIAALIRVLVGLGKTVLLTSYTHSAVDTILAKMSGEDFGILRLGNIDKVHPDVRQFTLAARRAPTTVEQLEQQLMAPPVVATTCLSIDHALFSRRTFDYCIVDEASQITLPTCLGPLRFADKFVLVGDHFQLPPLVRNLAARKGGLDVSLFRRLSCAHPDAVVDLTHQYRMNEDIMLLSNRLIYGDRLRCGNEEVAKRSLKLPDGGKFLQEMHVGEGMCGEDCWINRLLSESCKAVFIDTDLLPAHDARIGDLVQNPTEASLVYQVTETLIRSGVLESRIGVISLYRQQIKLLSHLLQGRKEVEILTADRSQGRDKDCIIISMVRSNDAGQIGDLVKDWRRMNVSFTRAQSKLVIFGSRRTLQSAPLLSEFFTLMSGKGWILQLPPKADIMHAHTINPVMSLQQIEERSPGKRVAVKMEECKKDEGKENQAGGRPTKKVKRPRVEDGVLRGRPILKDLFNGDN